MGQTADIQSLLSHSAVLNALDNIQHGAKNGRMHLYLSDAISLYLYLEEHEGMLLAPEAHVNLTDYDGKDVVDTGKGHLLIPVMHHLHSTMAHNVQDAENPCHLSQL